MFPGPYRTLLANDTRMREIGEEGKDGKIGRLGGSMRSR